MLILIHSFVCAVLTCLKLSIFIFSIEFNSKSSQRAFKDHSGSTRSTRRVVREHSESNLIIGV